MLVPVILSGGVGSRLWPVSRSAHPKPFLTLPDGENLISKTYRRAINLDGVQYIYTITNRELFFKTQDEFEQLKLQKSTQHHYILEPFGKNTAAAVLCAALETYKRFGKDVCILILASDHLIKDEKAFNDAVIKAKAIAKEDWLVTFGITPSHPETGYGYLECDKAQAIGQGIKLKKFIEKPSLKVAENYIAAGNYLWNSGMFCFKSIAIIEAFQTLSPEIYQTVTKTLNNSKTSTGENFSSLSLDSEKFNYVPDDSIDYAIMEKATKVAAVPCDIGWNDIGSWNAMSELTPSDENGNRCLGEVIIENARNNYVRANDRLTALLGVDNLMIIDTTDALLVAHKDSMQDVKKIVTQLKKTGHQAHELHTTVNRPWGTYTTLEEGERFKIKRIVVKPGASLSLQMHHHRSEHWIVVSGTANVVNDDNEFMLATNESTYIKAGHTHRLENPGVIDLVLIEVQSGDYLGEDDIVRIEDVYGRIN